ncbi:MAG TPA: hypothetical protein DHV36_16910 [Desulfobacteraceae bacterium]|nr:hypothetical protein [Desulfobacteraceae bacterium]
MNKRILVKTDDPKNKQFYLTVTGQVDSVVEISPATVSLSGVPGESLETYVTITPAEKYPFTIKEISQRFDSQIKAELIPPKDGEKDWQVKVLAHSDKADDLYDVITLKTDSTLKPKLKIRVYAIYFDESGKKS